MSNMKKSGKIYRIGALLVVVCLISTVMLSGTFARYVSEYSGQDTALVARWSFTAEGGQDGGLANITADDVQELDLFGHLYNTHINQKAADDDDDETTFIIAPGVSGKFVLEMDYLADVDADVLIIFEELTGNVIGVPIEYSVDEGTTWVTLEGLADKIKAAPPTNAAEEGDKTFRIAKVDNDSSEPVKISQTVHWKWRYTKEETGSAYTDQTDADDTALGVYSNAQGLDRTSYGIKITLTATQVTPTITTP